MLNSLFPSATKAEHLQSVCISLVFLEEAERQGKLRFLCYLVSECRPMACWEPFHWFLCLKRPGGPSLTQKLKNPKVIISTHLISVDSNKTHKGTQVFTIYAFWGNSHLLNHNWCPLVHFIHQSTSPLLLLQILFSLVPASVISSAQSCDLFQNVNQVMPLLKTSNGSCDPQNKT